MPIVMNIGGEVHGDACVPFEWNKLGSNVSMHMCIIYMHAHACLGLFGCFCDNECFHVNARL